MMLAFLIGGIWAVVGTALAFYLGPRLKQDFRSTYLEDEPQRVSPELLRSMQSEIIHNAMKRKPLRADFNRRFK